jgi:hypothetical protein
MPSQAVRSHQPRAPGRWRGEPGAVQSISAQLQQLREHNDQVRTRSRARVLLTRHNPPGAIDGLAETLFTTYRAQRIAERSRDDREAGGVNP